MVKSIFKKILVLIVIVSIFSISDIKLISYASSEDDVRRMTAPPSGSIDDTLQDATDFASGNSGDVIDESKLSDASNFLYNLLLGIGIIAAVIIGIILGTKYMLGSVEEKAAYKETLLVYVIGCVVIFGAFGIWKLTVNVLKDADSGITPNTTGGTHQSSSGVTHGGSRRACSFRGTFGKFLI